jgi:hypothetical protein
MVARIQWDLQHHETIDNMVPHQPEKKLTHITFQLLSRNINRNELSTQSYDTGMANSSVIILTIRSSH